MNSEILLKILFATALISADRNGELEKNTWGGARKGSGRKKENLHNIGFKVSDELFQQIERARGSKPRNAFLREAIKKLVG